MGKIKLTRMALLNLRKRKKLAMKGHSLLKRKRDALMVEFFEVLKGIKDTRSNFAGKFATAQKAMRNAQALQGEADIERLSLGTASGVSISMDSRNVMGVEVPMMNLEQGEPSWYGFYESTVELDEAVKLHRELLPQLIEIMEKQLALKKIGDEIKTVKRRVNSLEYIIIPRIETQEKMITLKLEQLEKEDFSRLKKIKQKVCA